MAAFYSSSRPWLIPEDMPIRMAHVHLARVPGHVGRRPRDLEALLDAPRVRGVDIVDPNRHPDRFLSSFVGLRAERRAIRNAPTAALAVQAQKDLALARAHAAERRRGSPSHAFFQPSFSNHSNVCCMSETFRMGVSRLACISLAPSLQRSAESDQRSQARIASLSIVSTNARLARHPAGLGELASRLYLSAVSKQRLMPVMITTCGADRGSAALKYP